MRTIIIIILTCTVHMLTAQPPNDDCSGAMAITPSFDCNMIMPDFSGATLSGVNCTCVPTPDGCNNNIDVWYKITLASPGTLKFLGTETMVGILGDWINYAEIYKGSCDPGIPGVLSYDTCITFHPADTSYMDVGTDTYYIRYLVDANINPLQNANVRSATSPEFCVMFSEATPCTNQPMIDPIADISVCNSYVLPPITGTNLSGSPVYYTGSGGTGTQYSPGESIAMSGTYYAYDVNGGCSDEVEFEVTIIPAQVLNIGPTCSNTTIVGQSGTGINNCELSVIDEAWYLVTLTETTNLDVTLIQGLGAESPTLSIYQGSLNNDGHVGCYAETHQVIALAPGEYCFQFLGFFGFGSIEGFCIFGEAPLCPNPPQINPHPNITTCDNYVLPPISGSNLTGNEAYYSQSEGMGIPYNPGYVVSSSGTFFIYDGTVSCSDEESFIITISPSISITKLEGSPSNRFWSKATGWSPQKPSICDDVIIPLEAEECIVDEPAFCKTLQVDLGVMFDVPLGFTLEVGDP